MRFATSCGHAPPSFTVAIANNPTGNELASGHRTYKLENPRIHQPIADFRLHLADSTTPGEFLQGSGLARSLSSRIGIDLKFRRISNPGA
jgi:hypothetical protein